MKHIVGKNLLRHTACKIPLMPQIHPVLRVSLKQTGGIVQKIAEGHGAVQKGQSLRLILAALSQDPQDFFLLPKEKFFSHTGRKSGLLLPCSLDSVLQQGHLPVKSSFYLRKILRRKHIDSILAAEKNKLLSCPMPVPCTECPAGCVFCRTCAPSRKYPCIPSPSHTPPWPSGNGDRRRRGMWSH